MIRSMLRDRAIDLSSRIALRNRTSHRVVVLLYHSIHETSPFSSATPAQFRDHLAWLDSNCSVVDYGSVLRGTYDQRKDRPVVAITFDDGFEDNHRNGLPILDDAGLRATFFLTTGLISGSELVRARFARLLGLDQASVVGMTWTQVRELRSAGMRIGSHTVTHPNLAVTPPAHLVSELEISRQILEDRLGAAVSDLAFPFGKPKHNFTSGVIEQVRSAGYESAAAVLYRPLKASDVPFQIPRFSVTNDSTDQLAAKVYGGWDLMGLWQEHAPRWLSGAVSPARRFREELPISVEEASP